MNTEELFGLFCVWCVVNSVLIFFLFNRDTQIKKLEKNLKKLDEKFTDISGAAINSTKELLCDRAVQSIMIRLRKEGFLFPFDNYEFCSTKFGEISKFFEDVYDVFRKEYTNIPDNYTIMKELVLPFYRDSWNENKWTDEFEQFIYRHNMQEKTKQ